VAQPPLRSPEIRARRWSRAEHSPHTLEHPATQTGLRSAGAIRARTTYCTSNSSVTINHAESPRTAGAT